MTAAAPATPNLTAADSEPQPPESHPIVGSARDEWPVIKTRPDARQLLLLSDITDAPVLLRLFQNLWLIFWASDRPYASVRWAAVAVLSLLALGGSCKSTGTGYERSAPPSVATRIAVPIIGNKTPKVRAKHRAFPDRPKPAKVCKEYDSAQP